MCPKIETEEEDPCGAPECFECPSWQAPCNQLFKCKDGSWKRLPDCPYYDAFPKNISKTQYAPDGWQHTNKTAIAPGFPTQKPDLSSYSNCLKFMREGYIFTEEDIEEFLRGDWMDIVPHEVRERCVIPKCLPCESPCQRQPTTWCDTWEVPVKICSDVNE